MWRFFKSHFPFLQPYSIYDAGLVFIILTSLLIGIISVTGLPLFSDSAFHASIIRDIVRSGDFPSKSPVGWVAVDMHPLSFAPFLTHPPLFYLMSAMMVLLGVNITTSLSIITILATILSVYYFYRIVCHFFNERLAFISALFLAATPMSIWINSHRIMEEVQILLGLCAIFYITKYLESISSKDIVLSGIFSAALLYIKITSLFVVVSTVIYLVLNKTKLKDLIVYALTISLLYLPYLGFSVVTRGSISYAPPGFPIIDHYIFKPWWNWQKSADELALNAESNQDNLIQSLKTFDRNKRSFIQDSFKKWNVIDVIQNYNTFRISNSANYSWFSTSTVFQYFYLALFVLGIVIFAVKYRHTKYHYLLMPLLILTTFYLTKSAEVRYYFTLNILCIVFYSIAFDEILNKYPASIFRVFITSVLMVSLTTFIYSEMATARRYKYSLVHNLMPEDQGFIELVKAKPIINTATKNVIFTPANSEVSWYLDKMTAWDYRLLFISEKSIVKYLDLYNVKQLILPNYLTNENIYNYKLKADVPNTKKYWQGTSIPLDSDFYKYINDKKMVTTVGNFNSFTIYERLNK